MHLFCSVYKTLTVTVFDDYQCEGLVLLASPSSRHLGSSSTLIHVYSSHYVCFFKKIANKSPNGNTRILPGQHPRQHHRLCKQGLPLLDFDFLRTKFTCLVGSTSWQPMGLSFWILSKHLLFNSRTRPSCFHDVCNISEIIPGPTFDQQKHKKIDSCKHDFSITFPVCPL